MWWQQSIQSAGNGIVISIQPPSPWNASLSLWSPASIVSPWVRHEASQAVARGIYTFVRLVPMAIGSPFDRLQATDLFG